MAEPEPKSDAVEAGLVPKAQALLTRFERQPPLLPMTIARVAQLSPHSPGNILLRLISVDPLLAVRSLMLVSDLIPSPISVDNLAHGAAASILIDSVRGSMFTSALVPTPCLLRELWVHSVAVATMSREIAVLAGYGDAVAEAAYLAGLVHDVGRFIALTAASERIAALANSGWDGGASLLASERDELGIDHESLGVNAATRWRLAPYLVAVIGWHHRPRQLPKDLSSSRTARTLVRLVSIADELTFLAEEVPSFDDLAVAEREEVFVAKGLLREGRYAPLRAHVAARLPAIARDAEQRVRCELEFKERSLEQELNANDRSVVGDDRIVDQRTIDRKSAVYV